MRENTEKNPIIRYAILLSKAILVLCGALFLGFLFLLICRYAAPERVSHVDVTQSFQAGFGVGGIKFYINPAQNPGNVIMLNDLPFGMVIWLFLRASFFFGISIAIIRKIIQILSSIQSIQTFYEDNIKHFQMLVIYGMAAFMVSCFNFILLNGNMHFNFTIAFGPLLFAVGSLVLAEVFKEGKALAEDKKMIV